LSQHDHLVAPLRQVAGKGVDYQFLPTDLGERRFGE
jgi:hypothetical protein